MKKFAIFLPDSEQATIIEGVSASVKRVKDGLKVVITHTDKTKTTFKGAIIFTEVSDKIKIY